MPFVPMEGVELKDTAVSVVCTGDESPRLSPNEIGSPHAHPDTSAAGPQPDDDTANSGPMSLDGDSKPIDGN